MYKKLVMRQNVVIFLHLLRFLCVNKESGFAPSEGLVGSVPESNAAPYETALRSQDGLCERRRRVPGTSQCTAFPRARGCREIPPQRSAPPRLAARLAEAQGKCFTLMGIDIW